MVGAAFGDDLPDRRLSAPVGGGDRIESLSLGGSFVFQAMIGPEQGQDGRARRAGELHRHVLEGVQPLGAKGLDHSVATQPASRK